jgi:hypothetical protein
MQIGCSAATVRLSLSLLITEIVRSKQSDFAGRPGCLQDEDKVKDDGICVLE